MQAVEEKWELLDVARKCFDVTTDEADKALSAVSRIIQSGNVTEGDVLEAIRGFARAWGGAHSPQKVREVLLCNFLLVG